MACQSMLARSSKAVAARPQRLAQPAISVRPVLAARAPARQAQRPAPRTVLVAAAGSIDKLNGEQLEVAIAGRDKPLIVDFYATWCGPCVLLAEELKKVNTELDGKIRIVKVDVDENPDLSSMLKIQGLPTIVFIPKDNGKPALRTEGLLPAAQIIEIVNNLDKQ